MNDKLMKFWELYDKYIETQSEDLMAELSGLLAEIEQPSRENQLLRPEKGWNRIIAWQVLRDQRFTCYKDSFRLNKGEILTWTPSTDRDVYLTRIPFEDRISGHIIRPGYNLTFQERERLTFEGKNSADRIITDERGLYLPLYDFRTVITLSYAEIEKAKRNIIDYLRKEKEVYEE